MKICFPGKKFCPLGQEFKQCRKAEKEKLFLKSVTYIFEHIDKTMQSP